MLLTVKNLEISPDKIVTIAHLHQHSNHITVCATRLCGVDHHMLRPIIKYIFTMYIEWINIWEFLYQTCKQLVQSPNCSQERVASNCVNLSPKAIDIHFLDFALNIVSLKYLSSNMLSLISSMALCFFSFGGAFLWSAWAKAIDMYDEISIWFSKKR